VEKWGGTYSFRSARPSYRLPITVARVRSCGIWVDKVALGQVFSEYFSFPCQFEFHWQLHNHHNLLSGAGTVGQTMAAAVSVSPYEKNIKKYRPS
jgi:hypothetical protein